MVRWLDLEEAFGLLAQGADQPVALLAVEGATDVRREMAFGDEPREHVLLQPRRLAVGEPEIAGRWPAIDSSKTPNARPPISGWRQALRKAACRTLPIR